MMGLNTGEGGGPYAGKPPSRDPFSKSKEKTKRDQRDEDHEGSREGGGGVGGQRSVLS